MVGFTLRTELYKTFRTEQNLVERNKTFYRFCLVLVRTLKWFSWFCFVLTAVLVGFVELGLAVLERSGTGIVLLIVLNAIWFSPTVLYRKVHIISDTVSNSGVPYYVDTVFIKYLEIE